MKTRAAAIILRDQLLLSIHRRKMGRDYYVLPGGGVQLDESFRDACIREVKEETGLDVISLQLVYSRKAAREEQYFIARVTEGEPVLGGPEVSHQSDQNSYTFEWLDAARLAEVNLLPIEAKRICQQILEQRSQRKNP